MGRCGLLRVAPGSPRLAPSGIGQHAGDRAKRGGARQEREIVRRPELLRRKRRRGRVASLPSGTTPSWSRNGATTPARSIPTMSGSSSRRTTEWTIRPTGRGRAFPAVRHLPLYSRTYASINPMGDHDTYTLAIPPRERCTYSNRALSNLRRGFSTAAERSCDSPTPTPPAPVTWPIRSPVPRPSAWK
jgi:hypothetical protein